MILIDTSAFIEFLNQTGSHFDREIEMLISNDDDISVVDIILTEILQGIKNDNEYNEIKRTLLSFPMYSLRIFILILLLLASTENAEKRGLLSEQLLTC